MESGSIFEHFLGFLLSHIYNLQNIKATKSETFLVSLTQAIKARNKQAAKAKLYILPSFPYAMYPPRNM